MKTNRMAILGLVSIAVGLNGCAASGLLKFSKNDLPKAGPKDPVARIVGMWQPATGNGLDNRTCRGFSGQILFFTQGTETPVQVDGDVKIYVFDDFGSPEDQIKPLHEVNLPAKSWNALLSRGPLGATYSVFIPYIREGNHEAKCSLRVRFKPANGPVVYSDMVNIALEGKKKPVPEETAPREYDEAAAGPHKAGQAVDSPAKDLASHAPPRARGLAEAIPAISGRDVARSKRSTAELTEEERARILREARAKFKAETKRDIELVTYDDDVPQRTPSRKPSTRRKSRNPLRETSNEEGTRNIVDDTDDTAESLAPIGRGLKSYRPHLLDEAEPVSAEEEVDFPTSNGTRPTMDDDLGQGDLRADEEAAAPPIDDARRQPARPATRGGVQTYTIKLPESLLSGT